jgi:hypothetical protein
MNVESPKAPSASDLTRRGKAALDLVRQVAETVASRESRFEAGLTKILTQLRSAEERHSALAKRATQAEKRAAEGEKWLRRLHARLEQEFSSMKRSAAQPG